MHIGGTTEQEKANTGGPWLLAVAVSRLRVDMTSSVTMGMSCLQKSNGGSAMRGNVDMFLTALPACDGSFQVETFSLVYRIPSQTPGS